MADNAQPGDGEQDRTPQDDRDGGTAPAAPAGDTAETRVLPGGVGGPSTPSRGTAAPLGTVGDGRYRLTGRLGRGGMAEVFAAQDVRLGRTVAVKLLRSELAQDDVARQRFTREAHSVASLNHHSIVAVYDTGEEREENGETTPYIVMELVEGRTVRELLVDEEAPPVDQALIIVAGVLEALAYSHRHGIVHRDIKPANVIITTGGAVKVMDFGIARALTGAATTMTQTGMVMGTPQYLSPEQALGKTVDHRSDLYAAGCMLYELLVLRPPFTGDTPLSVVYQHVQDNPVPPSRAGDRVSPQLDDLVLRALAKNPDDRYQSADEFRAHLQHALREMHGAGGAGYAAGSAAAAAAAAGLAAAATGNTGHYPGFDGSTGNGTSVTEPLGRTPDGGSSTTAEMPYQVTSPYQTPSQPYPGGGGPAGSDGGYDGYGGDGGGQEPGGRRNPWAWVLGAAAIVLAASIGIALALSGGDGSHTPTVTSTSTGAPTAQESPSEKASTAAPSRSPSSTRAPEVPTTVPTFTTTRSATPTRSGSPTASTSPSGSPTASSSASKPPTNNPSTATGNPAPSSLKPTLGGN
ncbi:protein kinase domain-containing protein [Kitasatospora camelliae]|uniref:non-specific serine/threonine protein kinase n=1 Tax=Kitasatospora camelliae TaxID=3156397 RepID=A0AAU8JZD6_9ACTN